MKGERLAAKHLEARGCEVIARNFRTRFGELDLVARDERFLVFCEVKTRIARGAAGRANPLGPFASTVLLAGTVTTGAPTSCAVNPSVWLPSLPASSVALQLMVTVAPTATWAPEAGDVPQSIVGVGSRASIAETV